MYWPLLNMYSENLGFGPGGFCYQGDLYKSGEVIIHIDIHMYTCIHIYIDLHIPILGSVYIYICMCIHIYIYTCIHLMHLHALIEASSVFMEDVRCKLQASPLRSSRNSERSRCFAAVRQNRVTGFLCVAMRGIQFELWVFDFSSDDLGLRDCQLAVV